MSLFPALSGESCEEYNALRESVQASIVLFQKFKTELQDIDEMTLPEGQTEKTANELIQQSKQLCNGCGGGLRDSAVVGE